MSHHWLKDTHMAECTICGTKKFKEPNHGNYIWVYYRLNDTKPTLKSPVCKPQEIWKVIPNTSNWYAISNFKRVKSFKSREEKILKSWTHRNKQRVTLCLRGGRKHFNVEDLFKKAFE